MSIYSPTNIKMLALLKFKYNLSERTKTYMSYEDLHMYHQKSGTYFSILLMAL